MLSIMVNDALIGIDVMKKYPALYSQLLADEQSRAAFLAILELLEQSWAGELPDYSGPDITNLDFLQQAGSRPIIRKTHEARLEFTWRKTAAQLQKIFSITAFQQGRGFRSGNLLLDESYVNLVYNTVKINEQELEVRLTAYPVVTNPENLNLILLVFTPEEITHQFEAAIDWGDYQHTVQVNMFDLARFPPLQITQVFTPSGKTKHDLALHLNQVD